MIYSHQRATAWLATALDSEGRQRQYPRWSAHGRQDVQPVLAAALQRLHQGVGRVVAEFAREERALDVEQLGGPAVGGAAALAVEVRRPDEAVPRHPVPDGAMVTPYTAADLTLAALWQPSKLCMAFVWRI